MFRLASPWVWDFWFADDGEQIHLDFLKNHEALHDLQRRHHQPRLARGTQKNDYL